MKTISAKRLQAAGACADQVQLFRDTFGDKTVPINAENWAKAGDVGLTRLWLERFLKKAAQAEYIRAYETAQAECIRAYETARAKFYRACDAEYNRACDAARAKFYRACDAARAKFYRACDVALLEALTK